ncbi:MAG: RNA polymerase sigma factor [Miltoncostaeaceae bacterium]
MSSETPGGVADEVAGEREERELVEALKAGDEAAFATLVDRYHASLVRVARSYVGSEAVAEEVAQDTWVGALNGIDRFEARSSVKTWLYRILTNRALTRRDRERRSVPFSALASDELDGDSAALDVERFLPADHPQWPNHWAVTPETWAAGGEERALAAETREVIDTAIAALPPAQRTVITMRDIEGFSSEDVCNVLEITESNQRVLLHRARTRVRAALNDYMVSG